MVIVRAPDVVVYEKRDEKSRDTVPLNVRNIASIGFPQKLNC
jgi:hypothetical protein